MCSSSPLSFRPVTGSLVAPDYMSLRGGPTVTAEGSTRSGPHVVGIPLVWRSSPLSFRPVTGTLVAPDYMSPGVALQRQLQAQRAGGAGAGAGAGGTGAGAGGGKWHPCSTARMGPGFLVSACPAWGGHGTWPL